MAATRAKARSGEAGARCRQAPGTPRRPKPRRTARRRRADTLTARRSRPSAGGRCAGTNQTRSRARSRAPRAAVFGGECARGASFKGEQESTCAAALVATSEPGVAGLRCGAGERQPLVPAFERAWRPWEASADTTLSSWKLWGAGWNLRVIYVDAEAGARSARACAPVARPLKVWVVQNLLE